MTDTTKLAERIEEFVTKAKRTIENDNLSTSGACLSLALLVNLNIDIIAEAAAALRAQEAHNG